LRAWTVPAFVPVVPVEVVFMDTQTAPSAPPPRATAALQRQAAVQPQRPRAVPAAPQTPQQQLASVVPPTGIVPPVAEPKPDALQDKLEALAMLRQPATDPRLVEGVGTAGTAMGGNGTARGPSTAYSVKDYVRAQVERRWNLDLGALGGRNISIAIRVLLHRDGTVEKAEIVDDRRYRTDPAYRSIALSARNAVLLSSPISLPAGTYDPVMDLTLNLNPRDTLR
jgi:hypothetical protein